MLRLFVAVTLPDDALKGCAQESLRLEQGLGAFARGVRFPLTEGLHFTLKFLGSAAEEKVTSIHEALTRAARSAGPFDLVLEGLKTFPAGHKPEIIYLDMVEGAAPMRKLADAVDMFVSPLGFRSDEGSFSPHVTLARVKDLKLGPKINEKVLGMPVVEVARVKVVDVALMASEQHQTGNVFRELLRVPLSGS